MFDSFLNNCRYLIHINKYIGTKLALKYLKQNNPQGGTIINTASVAAIYPMFSYGGYGAAKAGVCIFILI